MLKNVVLIDEDALDTSIVDVGASVKVRIITAGNVEAAYQIVGSAEANPFENRISNEAPVGKALLGHRIGDVVEVQTPGGLMEFEILSIGK